MLIYQWVWFRCLKNFNSILRLTFILSACPSHIHEMVTVQYFVNGMLSNFEEELV